MAIPTIIPSTIIPIPGTSSAMSALTGKTYSSVARAVAAEAQSIRMKMRAWDKKDPVSEDITDLIKYDDLPAEIKGWSHKKGSWLYEHQAWSDVMTYTELLNEYGLGVGGNDHTTDEALPKILDKNYPDYELDYVEDPETGEREWKIVKKAKKERLVDEEYISLLASNPLLKEIIDAGKITTGMPVKRAVDILIGLRL